MLYYSCKDVNMTLLETILLQRRVLWVWYPKGVHSYKCFLQPIHTLNSNCHLFMHIHLPGILLLATHAYTSNMQQTCMRTPWCSHWVSNCNEHFWGCKGGTVGVKRPTKIQYLPPLKPKIFWGGSPDPPTALRVHLTNMSQRQFDIWHTSDTLFGRNLFWSPIQWYEKGWKQHTSGIKAYLGAV